MFHVASLQYGERLHNDSWKLLETLQSISIDVQFKQDIPDSDLIEFEQIEGKVCLVSYAPIMGRTFNKETRSMEKQQVGFAKAIQQIDADVVAKMSKLTGMKLNLFSGNQLQTGNLEGYVALPQLISATTPKAWSLSPESVIYQVGTTFYTSNYFQGILPFYQDNTTFVGAVALLYSKDILKANIWNMIKMLTVVSCGCLLLIIPVAVFFSSSITSPIRQIISNLQDGIAHGDFSRNIVIQQKGELGDLANAYLTIKTIITHVHQEMDRLVQAVREGKLEQRGDVASFFGGWRDLIMGANYLIEAFVAPINVTADYIERLSKSDIPEQITIEYKGDFNKIKENLNQLGGDIRNVLTETAALSQAVQEGDVNVLGDAERFEGGWQQLIRGMNSLIRVLSHAVAETTALSQEMELARRIQTALLPRTLTNLHPDFEITAKMLPADEVGGDYYDVVFDCDGQLWFGIGDVSGHGVTPGLIMMMAQTVHTSITMNFQCTPKDVVTMVNKVLFQNVTKRLKTKHFMTFTALKYLQNGRFLHAGAHLALLVYRAHSQTCELIDTRGIFLNFIDDISHVTKDASFTLGIHDTLILYTDGLTEVWNAQHEMLDIHGFIDIVAMHAHEAVECMQESILSDVLAWCDNKIADDMTLVIIRRIQ